MAHEKVLKLRKPISEGKITELVIKEPSFKSLKKYGLPFDASGNIDFETASAHLQDAAGVHAVHLDEMAGSDAMKAVQIIGELMQPDAANDGADAEGN